MVGGGGGGQGAGGTSPGGRLMGVKVRVSDCHDGATSVRLEGAQRRGGLAECGGGGAEGWWAVGDGGEEASSNEENSNQRQHRTYSRRPGGVM
jgi:hypothetical protein